MKKDMKEILLEEQLRKFKYRTEYKINESPRYRSLISTDEEFDNMPELTNEAGEQEDAPKPEGEVPTEPSNDQPIGLGTPPPETGEAPVDIPLDVPPPTGGPADAPVDAMGDTGDSMEMPQTNPGQEVDTIQNDIIKHNIAAMQSIHDKLMGLDSSVQGLNTKLDSLNAEVEEVREPTNSEKLMNKTNVSYPYYFNLNDFWSNNWFDKKRDEAKEQGIRELPDGTFIADFDDLPQKSKMEIQDSFNDFNESVKKKNIIKEDINSVEKSEIDGRTKPSAINLIYKRIGTLTQGFFSDDSWQAVRKIFDVFNNMNLDWDILNTKYNGTMPPQSKIWELQINFIGNDGKPKSIYGRLVASGGGSVEDPLDRYDISLTLS